MISHPLIGRRQRLLAERLFSDWVHFLFKRTYNLSFLVFFPIELLFTKTGFLIFHVHSFIQYTVIYTTPRVH